MNMLLQCVSLFSVIFVVIVFVIREIRMDQENNINGKMRRSLQDIVRLWYSRPHSQEDAEAAGAELEAAIQNARDILEGRF